MAFLTDEDLDRLAERVFVKRESTLEAEGQAIDRADLINTVQRVRHRLNSAVETLPAVAFEPQPDDENGNEVWSAGQIVSHICKSQKRFTENVGNLVEYTLEPETDKLDSEETLPMTEARGAIKTATVLLRQTLRAIPDDADLSKTAETERFGNLSVKGWLMLVAIHEHGHVKQINSLVQ